MLGVKQGPKRDSNAPRQRGQQPHCGVEVGGTVVPWRGEEEVKRRRQMGLQPHHGRRCCLRKGFAFYPVTTRSPSLLGYEDPFGEKKKNSLEISKDPLRPRSSASGIFSRRKTHALVPFLRVSIPPCAGSRVFPASPTLSPRSPLPHSQQPEDLSKLQIWSCLAPTDSLWQLSFVPRVQSILLTPAQQT